VGFTATDRLDKVFEVGILLKGLDGLLEIAGGVLLLLIKPQYLNQLASTLTQHELSVDPHDFLSSYILHSTQNLAAGSLVFAIVHDLPHDDDLHYPGSVPAVARTIAQDLAGPGGRHGPSPCTTPSTSATWCASSPSAQTSAWTESIWSAP
jgi:hypothetical protein